MNYKVPSLLLLLSALGGCGETKAPSNETSEADNPQQTKAVQEPSNDEASNFTDKESPWTITTETDPMTDASVTKAEQVIVTQNSAQVVVTLSCGVMADDRKKEGVYELTAYDEYGEGKVFTQQVSTDLFGDSNVVTEFLVRADKQEPVKTSFAVEYQNQIKFSQTRKDRRSEKQYWVKDRQECYQNFEFTNRLSADRIIVSLPFTDGEEYLEIDQTDSDFRKFASQCKFGDTALNSQYFVLMKENPAAYYKPCESRKYELDTLPSNMVSFGENAYYVP